jgi:hypothetical protein
MSSKRLHLVLIGLISLLLAGLVAGAYGINSLLSSEAVKLTGLKAKHAALNQEQLSLVKAKQELKQYAELEKIARAVVPEDKNQAAAVREIVNIAEANGVQLASISFPASTLGTSKTGAAVTTTPSAADSKAGALSQLQPVKNIPGVYQLIISVNGSPNQPVQYDRFIAFLSDLEHNRRTAQVSTITLQPNAANRNLLSFSLTLNEYIKP